MYDPSYKYEIFMRYKIYEYHSDLNPDYYFDFIKTITPEGHQRAKR